MGNFSNAKAVTFLDVETTSLDPKKSAILQISVITDWEDGTQEVWTTKIKPRSLELEFASTEALKVCKYSDEDWENAPHFEDVAEKIANKIAWGPLVAHNAQFDIAHLKASFERRGWRQPEFNEKFDASKKMFKIGYPVIDTWGLAYIFLPSERQNLNALREYFNIDTSRAHSADTDVEDCREIFYNIVNTTLII